MAKDEEFSTKIDTESDKKQKIRFGTTGFTIKVEFQWIMKPSDCCGDDNSFPRARIYGYADEESWSPGVYEGEVNEREFHMAGRMERLGSLQKTGISSVRERSRLHTAYTVISAWTEIWFQGADLGWKKATLDFGRCRMHGYGTERRPPSKAVEQGDVYSGMWAHGKRSGLGVRRWHEDRGMPAHGLEIEWKGTVHLRGHRDLSILEHGKSTRSHPSSKR